MDKKISLKEYAALALAAFIVFLPVLWSGFLNWDDHTHIYQNEAVLSFDFPAIFTQTVNETYIPLTTLTFAVEHAFFGLNAAVVHVDNLLLHIVVAVLLMMFFVQMGASRRASFLGALLFAIHPMRVESIAWATERKDVLYALFYVMALRQWWGYLDDKKIRGFCLTLLWGALSLLSKPMAISLPLVLMFMHWFKFGSWRYIRGWIYIPFWIMSAALGWMTYAHHVRNPVGDPGMAALIWVWTLGFYIWKFIFPVMLYPAYDLPVPVGLWHWPYAASLILFIALTVWLWITARKHLDKWLLWAAGFFFFSLFFLFRLDARDAHLVAERFMYLPCAGICLWLGIRADQALVRYGRRALAVLILVFIFLGIRSFTYTFVWKDSETLWSYVIKHYPKKELAYNNRAVAYGEAGRYDLAIADHTTVLTFPSNRALAFYNRGLNYRDWAKQKGGLGQQKEMMRLYALALADFDMAIREDPNYARTYQHRGMVKYALHDLQGALADMNSAIARDPSYVQAYINRGNIRSAAGDFERAFADYRKALELGAEGAEVYNNIGVSYARQGAMDLAITHFDEAIRRNTGYAEAYFNRSVAFWKKGQLKPAVDDVLRARALGLDIDQDYWRSLQSEAGQKNSGQLKN